MTNWMIWYHFNPPYRSISAFSWLVIRMRTWTKFLVVSLPTLEKILSTPYQVHVTAMICEYSERTTSNCIYFQTSSWLLWTVIETSDQPVYLRELLMWRADSNLTSTPQQTTQTHITSSSGWMSSSSVSCSTGIGPQMCGWRESSYWGSVLKLMTHYIMHIQKVSTMQHIL